MKRLLKYLCLLNIIGFSFVSATLIIYYLNKPFAWGELMISLNLLTSIPFIISGIITLKNIDNPNSKQSKLILIFVFSMLFLPSIALPFAYEIGGLLICLSILGIGIFVIFKLKVPIKRLIFINNVGLFFLFLNSYIVINTLLELNYI